ncbi:MAG: hypothetical protein CUN54_06720 [Phototrophicales bacterium]|nr:MAG: hypothetical protein CUN54_06720 [Phototrophicales bacterium]
MSQEILWAGDIPSETLATLRSNIAPDYTIVVATSFDGVMSHLREHTVKAVLFDVTQPNFNTIYLCQQIKNRDNAPLVIAFNHRNIALRDACLVAGADAVLENPLDGDKLKLILADPVRHIENTTTTNVILGNTPEKILSAASLLSHDLKSPISVIISSIEALTTLFDELYGIKDLVPLLQGTLSAGYRQMYLIDDMIDLARLQLGGYPMVKTRGDIRQIIEDAVSLPPYIQNKKKLNIEKYLPELGTIFAYVDVDLVRRAVAAMMDNTYKFTIQGDCLTIRAEQVDDMVLIAFEDNGRPIYDEFQHEIVRRAAHWEGRQAGTRTSVAAGLPFVFAVAQAHGGSFSGATDSESGLTTFTLRLPVGKEVIESDGRKSD